MLRMALYTVPAGIEKLLSVDTVTHFARMPPPRPTMNFAHDAPLTIDLNRLSCCLQSCSSKALGAVILKH
jgi:hypothetical protein